MLFSGATRNYRCPDCAEDFGDVVPTSLLPSLGTVAGSSVLWHPTLAALLSTRWLSVCSSVLLPIATLWLSFAAIRLLTSWKVSRGICPSCGGALDRTGGGFYDSMIPVPTELVAYLLTLLPAVAFRFYA